MSFFCRIKSLDKLHVVSVSRQWHPGWHTPGSNILWITSEAPAPAQPRDPVFAPGLWGQLTREKGKQLSHEFCSEPCTLGHFITSCSQDKCRLSITGHLQFCLVLVWIYFSSSTAALGTSISLSLNIQISWLCFSFIKISSGSLHCWSFMGMTSF